MSTAATSTRKMAPATPAPHRPSGWGAVARAELRAAGGAMRRELAVLGVFIVTITVLTFVLRLNTSFTEAFALGDLTFPLVLLSLVAPVAISKGERPTPGYRWSLPLDRPRHALLRVLGGWAWLMALVAGYLLWTLVLNALAEGPVHVGVEWAHVLTQRQLPPDQPMLDMVVADHPWIWVVPFTSTTLGYLLGSAAVLASRHPWRWFAGTVFAWVVVAHIAGAARLEWLNEARRAITAGRYGLVSALTGVPGAAAWAGATLLWTALAVAGVAAAAYRHRDDA